MAGFVLVSLFGSPPVASLDPQLLVLVLSPVSERLPSAFVVWPWYYHLSTSCVFELLELAAMSNLLPLDLLLMSLCFNTLLEQMALLYICSYLYITLLELVESQGVCSLEISMLLVESSQFLLCLEKLVVPSLH